MDSLKVSRKALIVGAAGQDGQNLARLLSSKGYEVVALVRGQPSERYQALERVAGARLIYGDITDHAAIRFHIDKEQPQELYNLAALSSSVECGLRPSECLNVNAVAVGGILEACAKVSPSCRVFQACSVDYYRGGPHTAPVDLNEPHTPYSVYAVSKATAHSLCRLYRDKGLYCSVAVLYPHESLIRPANYLSRKISRHLSVAKSALLSGRPAPEPLVLRDPHHHNDWGWSEDFVEAYWRALQPPTPRDFIVGTGVRTALLDVVNEALSVAGLSSEVVRWTTTGLSEERPHSKSDHPPGWTPLVSGVEVIRRIVLNDLLSASLLAV